ncbi:hypothetical protein [Haloferula sp.]|uniref:hypothetical protein n=1 Tax=Haloferula sp. TaxID=2497595 RepID=UPI003C7793D3
MNKPVPASLLRLLALGCTSLGTAIAGSEPSDITAPPTLTPPSSECDWEFRIEPYLWVPGVDGTLGIRGRTTEIDFDVSDLLSSSGNNNETYDIEMLFAMQLEARKDRWGILADAVYVDLDITGSRPTPRHLSANLDYTELLGNLLVTYRITDEPNSFLDLYVGARVNSLSFDLRAQADLINFPLEPAIYDSQTETWVDPVIGFRGQWNFTEKWFLAGKADIGGFGVSSELLWSAQATVGYQFTDRFSTEIGYSYYDTDYEDGGFVYDIAMGGVFLGFNFDL